MNEPTHSPIGGGARVFATQRYRLSTLTVREHLLVVVLKGVKGLHALHKVLTARQGQGIMIARGTQWDVVNDPEGLTQYEAIALSFPDRLIHALSQHPLPAQRCTVKHANVLAIDDDLLEALIRTVPRKPGMRLSNEILQHRVVEVLLHLRERGYQFDETQKVSWNEQIRRLVAQRPDVDWSASKLAAKFHVSESTLRRRMSSADLSLVGLVRDVRLETALGLLQTTNLLVGEVAHQCGWASHSRFSAAFAERWGVSPSVVRGRKTGLAQELTESG
ncbi:MAG: helix-turn-helix transcriptional regulator [Hydrogenophaga sp.]|uniref:helix-turn-helix transcriptional regulator n=1 Tax=Hydrogenophaga sp. TaxID=1904254 RepID=UPI00271777B9|nr:helix-turn-helix transcriptional regulator [Hydrogenophaga sp.]MDO9483203.1 helix-turn-helix transcriptional regulator [Hydrogenophaga sp.]MDP3342884.1 helix-turn-helix transcriptional regulator [Hydrogenophaga sp.]MDP3808759.1 helix-turn-helix transcriptional regulator [Hydrogenophaga sp.]